MRNQEPTQARVRGGQAGMRDHLMRWADNVQFDKLIDRYEKQYIIVDRFATYCILLASLFASRYLSHLVARRVGPHLISLLPYLHRTIRPRTRVPNGMGVPLSYAALLAEVELGGPSRVAPGH